MPDFSVIVNKRPEMCGRFENTIPVSDLINLNLFSQEDHLPADSSPKHNIAPTQTIITIMQENGKIRSVPMNWGIKFKNDSPLIFNSRIETIKEKPYWMNLFDKNRCLVPMSAFYEWVKENGSTRKTPHRIYLKDKKFFFVPALYVERGDEFFASLITTTPNKFIEKIHHRMPVILRPEEALEYLTNDYSSNLIKCVPYPDSNGMISIKADI